MTTIVIEYIGENSNKKGENITMRDLILKEMNEKNADGVDFVPIWFHTYIPPVYQSMTRAEVETANGYPRTARLYWKKVNGKKTYIDEPPFKEGIKEISL